MQHRECADCGEVIEEKRIKYMPDTTTCVSCQRIREQNGQFFRHKMDIQASCKAGEIDEIHETIIRG